MNAEPAASRFHEGSILGIGAGIVSVVAVGFLCQALGAPYVVQTAATASAIGLPAAIEYSIFARRRNKIADASRIRQGDLRRPIGLVVAMFAAALVVLFLIDSVIGRIFTEALADGIEISHATAIVMAILGIATIAVLGFFISSYASHYLGKKPYLWTTVAVVTVFVLRALLALVEYRTTPVEQRAILSQYGVTTPLLIRLFAANLIYFAACLAGTWHGRHRHDQFLTKKLARIQRDAARAADAPDDTTPPAPPQASGLDLLELIDKLGNLRATGLITDEEFQAKKTEILARL